MSRYTGPSWKISRRLGYSISGTGKEIAKRNYAPGQHGQSQGKLKEYGTQQREKQRVRFIYGMSEKQFRKTFDEAARQDGMTGPNFMKLLERRLDNVVYRLGLASTRAQARQLVNHGHVLVNGKKVDIPSYRLNAGQTISLTEKAKGFAVVKAAREAVISLPEYVSFDETTFTGTLVRIPERDEFLTDINDQLIVEFYSR
ncbi:MAG: 30S ribosomal protein S4 [Acholeplasmatales bacterium]|nr:30S ribosomal protein S4 [Acholeplasmatales bacterium]